MAKPDVMCRFTDMDEAVTLKEGACPAIDLEHGEHNTNVPGDRRLDDKTRSFRPKALSLERRRNANRVELKIRAARPDHEEAHIGSFTLDDLSVIKFKLLTKLGPFARFIPLAARCGDGVSKRREKSSFEEPLIGRSGLTCRDHVARSGGLTRPSNRPCRQRRRTPSDTVRLNAWLASRIAPRVPH